MNQGDVFFSCLFFPFFFRMALLSSLYQKHFEHSQKPKQNQKPATVYWSEQRFSFRCLSVHLTSKMALRLNPIQYRVGCGLYFLGLVMLSSSITIPDFWIHDQENAASLKHHGRSAWDVSVRICLGPRLGPWRCGKIFADYSKFQDYHRLEQLRTWNMLVASH